MYDWETGLEKLGFQKPVSLAPSFTHGSTQANSTCHFVSRYFYVLMKQLCKHLSQWLRDIFSNTNCHELNRK